MAQAQLNSSVSAFPLSDLHCLMLLVVLVTALWLQEVASKTLRKVRTARSSFPPPQFILIDSSSFLQPHFEDVWCHSSTSGVSQCQTSQQPWAFAILGAPSAHPFRPCSVSYLSLPVMHHSPPIIALVCWVDLSSLQNNSFISEIGLEINTNSAPPIWKQPECYHYFMMHWEQVPCLFIQSV